MGGSQAQFTLRRLAKQIARQAQKNARRPNFRSPWAGGWPSLCQALHSADAWALCMGDWLVSSAHLAAGPCSYSSLVVAH